MTPPNAYRPPLGYFNGHVETILPALFRKVEGVVYRRERIDTPDGDFLDLDWLDAGESDALIVISHGLEGNSHRAYVQGMARVFHRQGYHVLAWNYRSCSGEMNRKVRFYHSGATDDLDVVLTHVRSQNRYKRVGLVGFSLGGNLTLKYLGEKGNALGDDIRKAILFSVPLHLHSSCLELMKPKNYLYSQRFLKTLKEKVLEKERIMPGTMPVKTLGKISDLIAYDDEVTAPLHGFKNAVHYYSSCSALSFLPDIRIPALIVNATNDPFLSPQCFPEKSLATHPLVTLEMPGKGGHVGFTLRNEEGFYWSELRALHFMKSEGGNF
jgi:uncharacterized protein